MYIYICIYVQPMYVYIIEKGGEKTTTRRYLVTASNSTGKLQNREIKATYSGLMRLQYHATPCRAVAALPAAPAFSRRLPGTLEAVFQFPLFCSVLQHVAGASRQFQVGDGRGSRAKKPK